MSNDETAFAEFFQESWDPCLRAVAASTGDMLLAEDQVAEAFARAWASWQKVSRHPAPRAWVVRTALNAGQREVIVLRVFLDLNIETTARQLAIAPGTVRAHLSRAVTALRNELAQANTTEADPCPTPTR